MSNGGSYDPRSVEPDIYKFWEAGGYFHAEPDPNRKPYVIDIPLPNVTGALHLGHALNNTVQDLLIRHKRMCGYNAMWMPGTDHAGIATQAVVEKRLKEDEGLTRHEIGRETLVERIWAWKEQYGGRILQQLREIGCSCDWERTRFTLDEVCAKAVYEVFFRFFKDGLIYRGLRLVNWDAHLQTAVADDEIIHETVQSNLWHYRYPILPEETEGLGDSGIEEALERATREGAKQGTDYLSIATTRPETMLGDTAIAVHPDDERYKHLHGRFCLLPLQNRAIPIIADAILVKPEFGTGCVKVTPGHDPNDYDCGQRNSLGMINILTTDGRINDNGGDKYSGQSAEDARRQVVADLEALGLMEQIEPYQHEVGHSDRSKTPIEPMLSEQWFMKMADLCELAMGAVRDGRVKFFPQRYANTYLDWLGEKRDWCISRQLWWGHRIPVWHVDTQPVAIRGELLGESRERLTEVRGLLEGYLESSNVPSSDYCLRTTAEGALYVCAVENRAREALGDLEREWEDLHARYDTRRRPGEAYARIDSPSSDARALAIELTQMSVAVQQDRDVLDTWFSSALWPFSTLGWPDDYGRDSGIEGLRDSEGGGEGTSIPQSPNPSIPLRDLDYFYPTSTLVTARGIITLWVARMVMTSLYFNKVVPFDHVCIHPNILDSQGRIMSKSKGNGVDPLDIVQLYGADALRFTLTQMATETQDMRLPVSYLCPHCEHLTPQDAVVPKGKFPFEVQKVKCSLCKQTFATVWATDALKQELGVARDTSDRFEIGRNLCNKLWQATNGFVLANLEGYEPRSLTSDDMRLEDRWILSRLSACIAEADRRLAVYQLNEAANTLYAFFWSDFCDWYVELLKPRLFGRNEAGEIVQHSDESAATARQVLVHVLDQVLRLMHPIMPFITEALWQKLNQAAPRRGLTDVRPGETALITAAWPDAGAWQRDLDVEREMAALQDIIRALRDIRTRVNALRAAAKQSSLRTLPRAVIHADAEVATRLKRREAVIHRLGQCDELEIGSDVAKPPESASAVFPGIEVFVPLAGLADLGIERKRLRKECDELAGHMKRLEGKLTNEGFVSKAPADVVERERARLVELKDKLAALERNLAEISG
ncbi:MAG: valine--tRNA ligase [Planctomycetes bacterium]|nr:valine--tRNA ligase [Planctomycetota bacterium]